MRWSSLGDLELQQLFDIKPVNKIEINPQNSLQFDTRVKDLHAVYWSRFELYFQCKNAPLPVTKVVDPVDRDIEYVPSRVCDPRHLIAGKKDKGKSSVKISFVKKPRVVVAPYDEANILNEYATCYSRLRGQPSQSYLC